MLENIKVKKLLIDLYKKQARFHLGNKWGIIAETLINKGIAKGCFWFESTSAHQDTAIMQKTMHKAVFFFVFLHKYSSKNAFLV